MARSQVGATLAAKAPKTVVWKGEERDAGALASEGLKILEAAFKKYQSTRAGDAVYGYLSAVYGFATSFRRSPDCTRVARRMARNKKYPVRKNQSSWSLLIRASATVNEKTRWKWSTCLDYAKAERVKPSDLKQFIRGQGRINECASKGAEALKV